MPTISQLVRKGRKTIASASDSPALKECPQKKRSLYSSKNNNS